MLSNVDLEDKVTTLESEIGVLTSVVDVVSSLRKEVDKLNHFMLQYLEEREAQKAAPKAK